MALPGWLAVIEHAPAATKVTLAPATVQKVGVVDVYVKLNPAASVVPVSASGETLNALLVIGANVIVWLALATVNVNDWFTVGVGAPTEVAAILNVYTPAVVGVPESTPLVPAASVIGPPVPAGMVAANVGVGVPVAVTVNVPAAPTVNVVAAALVNAGVTGVGDGVKELLTPAPPVPPGPVAVTEQVCAVPLGRALSVRVSAAVPTAESVPGFGLQTTV